MHTRLFFMLLCGYISVLYAGDSTVTASADSVFSASPVALCTLDVVTDPAGAIIILDGITYGATPLIIPGISSGKHTIVIQRSGYFQKKAVLTLSEAQKIPLVFKLSAPGRLTITTVPDGATLTLNGNKCGATPFIDSLIKPGTYHLILEKTNFKTVQDTITIAGNDTISVMDTLAETDTYRDSVNVAAKTRETAAKRFNLSIIGGTFLVFLLAILIVEVRQ